jgi:hypothetical protein
MNCYAFLKSTLQSVVSFKVMEVVSVNLLSITVFTLSRLPLRGGDRNVTIIEHVTGISQPPNTVGVDDILFAWIQLVAEYIGANRRLVTTF